MADAPPYLFSVDLEDVRTMFPGGERFRPRVPAMAERLLRALESHRARGTFFVVGSVARAYPALVREIAEAGHEIACHTDAHLPLDRMDAAALRDDLRRNVDALLAAGTPLPRGFRAPLFSLTERTAWAYEVLAELGFAYSSSVLPAANPLHGWPGFGSGPRRMAGVLELPMTVLPAGPLRVPFGGGVYFRALPWPVVWWAFRWHRRRGLPVLGYLHPYDVDEEQERFMHPGIGGNRAYNALLYHNRGAVFPRLERVRAMGFRWISYAEHLAALPA
jgi:polysaccharide deacetylase family protein (PEP-CTERM system associated)